MASNKPLPIITGKDRAMSNRFNALERIDNSAPRIVLRNIPNYFHMISCLAEGGTGDMKRLAILAMVTAAASFFSAGCAENMVVSGGLGRPIAAIQYHPYQPVSTARGFAGQQSSFQISTEISRPNSPVEPDLDYLDSAIRNAIRAHGSRSAGRNEQGSVQLSFSFSRYVTRQYEANLYRTFIDAEYWMEPTDGSTKRLPTVVCSLAGVASTPQKANAAALDKLFDKLFRYPAAVDYLAGLNSAPPAAGPVNRIQHSPPAGEPSELLENIPRGGEASPFDIAVVIGNWDYATAGIPDVDFAGQDASTVKKYLEVTLGFSPDNILYVENATYAKFSELFGNEREYRGRLFRMVKPGISRVFVYYAGHGAPDLDTGEAYFVPTDANPRYLKTNGYRLKTFYQNLGRIPAAGFLIVLDSCFSGNSAKGLLIKGISSITLRTKKVQPHLDNALIMTSSAQDQVSSWYDQKGHSLFTYYFLKGLKGAANRNGDKILTGTELESYLSEHVPYMAGRLSGLDQTPTFTGNSGLPIVRYN